MGESLLLSLSIPEELNAMIVFVIAGEESWQYIPPPDVALFLDIVLLVIAGEE